MAGLYAVALAFLILGGILLLTSFRHLFVAHRHWRARRHVAAMLRAAWMLVFAALALLALGLGLALRGYRLLMAEEPVATLVARQTAPQQFALRLDYPDGSHRSESLHGDEWQLDARVIKWTPRAIELGARPLYRVDRLSGRFRDAAQAAGTNPSVVELGGESMLDLWQLKRQFPQWLPWIDADYGSAAYLPLVDGASYRVTLSPVGGLIARPADQASADKLKAAGW
jgi:phosphatidylglycerophosphate synthase